MRALLEKRLWPLAKEERSAAWLGKITGHDIVQRGMFWSAKGRHKKNREKSGQADRLGGVTPLQPDRFYFVKILTHFVLYKMAK